jgi:hypothetical protein
VDFADAMDLAGFPQQAFGEGGFAGVNMGNDAEVAPEVLGLGLGVHDLDLAANIREPHAAVG